MIQRAIAVNEKICIFCRLTTKECLTEYHIQNDAVTL